MARGFTLTFLFALLLAPMVFAAACMPGRTATQAEVETLGKRAYPGRSKAELFKASDLALRTLGFEVVVADTATGRIKTAPKTMVVQAAGGYGRAIAVSNEIAWSIEMTSASDGMKVQAIPRASSGGQSYDGPWDADYIERSLADLFKEIESNLPGAASRASESKTPEAAPKASESETPEEAAPKAKPKAKPTGKKK